MQELKSSEVSQMSEEELIELIEESRKETANLLSQELKEFYYQQQDVEIKKIKLSSVEYSYTNAQTL